MNKTVVVVIGGQFGSESKGKVVAYLAPEIDVAVRTGAPNAGHTVIHDHQTYKLRQIPATVFNPKCTLCIGAGALIDPEVLAAEVKLTNCHDRLLIDPHAGIITPKHARQEQKAELKNKIGSASIGIGAALADRIARTGFKLAKDVLGQYQLTNISKFINTHIDEGKKILVEGTQGFGLSLYHGSYPFVTSRDTTAANFLAEAGLSPLVVKDIILVIRTYPIRVGGNSGPLLNEITWDEISREVGKPVIEHTTVTNNVRRVGRFDPILVKQAIQVNRPTQIALQFINYLFPQDENVTSWNNLSLKARKYVENLETELRVHITLIGTGAAAEAMIDRR
jgi:adenylosuccinate synthase